MKEWEGELGRKDAIALLDAVTDKDDPYWVDLVEDFYDEDTDTWPSIYHVFAALGVTEEEYKEATGADHTKWPTI